MAWTPPVQESNRPYTVAGSGFQEAIEWAVRSAQLVAAPALKHWVLPSGALRPVLGPWGAATARGIRLRGDAFAGSHVSDAGGGLWGAAAAEAFVAKARAE